MHRGVSDFIAWLDANQTRSDVKLNPPASLQDLEGIEHQIGAPLPIDMRLVFGRFNGATTPTGTLLMGAPGPGVTVETSLREVANKLGRSFLDSDMLLPFFKTAEGAVLAFDRSAAPLPDTWPVVDFDTETGESRIVHRTFDGWCRMSLLEWQRVDSDFTLSRYEAQGRDHVAIEPDVSVAHVTLAHAQKRNGLPEVALASYLEAGRCIPSVPWADWEALKLAVLLDVPSALEECALRLCRRAPKALWAKRETNLVQVAYVVARHAQQRVASDQRSSWLRILQRLAYQATDASELAVIETMKECATNPKLWLPVPLAKRVGLVPPEADLDAWWARAQAAYRDGTLRDDDLVLDATYAQLEEKFRLVDLLRIRRDF